MTSSGATPATTRSTGTAVTTQSTAGADLIRGGDGKDVLFGGDGDDEIIGGNHDDQLYGGGGDDSLKGTAKNDYLDGQEGSDTLEGGVEDDLLVGRDGDDTLVGGTGDDFIVIIGSDLQGYTIHGDDAAENTGNRDDDLLLFAKDVNPDQVTVKVLDGHTHYELNDGLLTEEDIDLDIAAEQQAGRIRHVEAFETGTGDDTIKGTDLTGHNTYWERFHRAGESWLEVDELFFTHDGDDTVETRGGNDFVDAGAGDDTVICGSGAHVLRLGPGQDKAVFHADELDGPEGATGQKHSRFLDMASGDQIIINGGVTPADVVLTSKVQGKDRYTQVAVNGEPEFDLWGLRKTQVRVDAGPEGGVIVTATSGAGDVTAPPTEVEEAEAPKKPRR